ncbi:DinB family protein [Fredinandcohnia humi]
MINFRIKQKEGYTEKIGELVTMLEHTRDITLEEISQLSQSELDYLPDNTSNSIGALLLHMASIEYVHQIISFENRDPNEKELAKWQVALELGEKGRAGIKGNPLSYYLDEFSQVRAKTLELMGSRNDSWLYEENQWDNGVTYNNYYLWYHVIEDEISHRGQIKTIKRLLAKKAMLDVGM